MCVCVCVCVLCTIHIMYMAESYMYMYFQSLESVQSVVPRDSMCTVCTSIVTQLAYTQQNKCEEFKTIPTQPVTLPAPAQIHVCNTATKTQHSMAAVPATSLHAHTHTLYSSETESTPKGHTKPGLSVLVA